MKKQERKRYFQHILGVGVYENSLRPVFFQKAGHRGEKILFTPKVKKNIGCDWSDSCWMIKWIENG